MTCGKECGHSNEQGKKTGGTMIQSPGSKSPRKKPAAKMEWQVQEELNGTKLFWMFANGRKSRAFIHYDPRDRHFKYRLYGAGMSPQGFALELGKFRRLSDAKRAAQEKQLEWMEEKANQKTIDPDSLEIEFNTLRNLFGAPLSDEVRERLRAVILNPTPDTWDDACGIILRSSPMLTLWQAVCEVIYGFPTTGRMTDINGNVIKEWASIPTSQELVEAVRYAAYRAPENNWDGQKYMDDDMDGYN